MQQDSTADEQDKTQQSGTMSLASVHEQPITLDGKEERELYGYLERAIYHLDSRTHQIVWKYTCVNGEVMQDGILIVKDVSIACVVGGILFVETQGNPGHLYALNAATGSVLWKQPSAGAFVNSIAVYTLGKSTTSGINTLTACDPQTGQNLWQYQYPSMETEDYLEQRTDGLRDFRLIAVTDQLLYAVSLQSAHRNPRPDEQDIFACYGLNPEDGAILWQTTEVISGFMSRVVAQIVDGVIYTAEYTFKGIAPPTDARGGSVHSVPQLRVTASDAGTGKRLWQTPMREGEFPNGFFSLLVSGDLLYYQTTRSEPPARHRQYNTIATLCALNIRDGTVRWEHQITYKGVTGAVLEGKSLYLETSDFNQAGELQLNVVAFDAQTGAVRWSTPVELVDGTEKMPRNGGGYSIDMTPVASKDAVYYSTPGSRVYVLRPSDGKILEQFWVDKTDQTTVQDRVVLFVVP